MFEEYNPLDNKIFRIIDNSGKVKNKKHFPEIDSKEVVEAYKKMLFARTADLLTVNYQRQGRIFTYPPNYGQEAIHAGVASVIRHEDWLVPAFREVGVMLAKGVTLKEIFLYYMGNEDASRFQNANNVLPVSVPIASQLIHAVGIGYEIKLNKKKEVVYTFVGDGGTSEGDFHEALNFAGVWGVPVVFIIQNNQYGISTPTSIQTASINLAVKSVAYGIKGIKVDGNDFFAMHAAVKQAHEYALEEGKPVLIEALTYRKGPHTTSDDPTKYRTAEEEKEWDKTDPLKRLKMWLEDQKLVDWDEESLIEDYKKEADRQFVEAENYHPYPVEDVFKYQYVEMPEDLKEQQRNYEKFLKWQESLSK
ncbi:MAG: pyruvate dehydrogenase (acetyl-transferring) E1 component subunit alpha [Bacteroidales bacterium]|nr:pyruvate dehydrogenase (acetyl-transferring) E1 component subunit alpha [Bacteroidales bacterium]